MFNMKNDDVINSNNNDLLLNNEGLGDDEDDSKIFPQRLMAILSDELNQESICWLPHGRAFIVRNRKLFAETVMPRYFSRKAKYSSFTRKLNRWNFIRVSSGPELGAYHHEFFLRDKPHLAAQMFCKNARTMLAMASTSSPSTGAILEPVSLKRDPTESEPAISAIRELDESSSRKPAFSLVAPTPQQPTVHHNRHLEPNPIMGSAFSTPHFASVQASPSNPDQLNAVMGLKRDHFMGMLGGQTPANVMEMLERQLQFVQRQRQQDQANRLLLSMQMGQQQQQQQTQQHQVGANKNMYNAQMSTQDQHDFQVLQLRQKMEANKIQQQQKIQRPSNNRASAA